MGDQLSIRPKKYYTRVQFSWEEKEDICNKSDQKCCHCGKPIFVGYGATVDHFIPLNKGGSNQFINLIPLCKECNDSKEDKLYSIDYIVYIKDKYRKQISDYLDSYVQVVDYVRRHRLLAYDEYKQSTTIVPRNFMINNKRKNYSKGIRCKYTLKYATFNDLDKMHQYLVKYLKKNNALDSIESARENIIFWMQFGCIYYVEKNNEVTNMFALTIKHLSKYEDYRGIVNQPYMYIFPYYQTDISERILVDMIHEIHKLIMAENNLSLVPINIILLEEEKAASLLSLVLKTNPTPDNVEGLVVFRVLIGDDSAISDYSNIHREYDELNEVERKTYDFFSKFDDITDQMIKYFEKYQDRAHISWMINSILSPEEIQNSKLKNYVKFSYEEE